MQGLGWALMEGFDYGPDGRLRNASLLDYRMPTALDVPKIDCVIIETPVPGVPYGVRGVGEVPIVPPAAAVANAIARAIGVRIHHMPMTPERVLAALRRQDAGANRRARLASTNVLGTKSLQRRSIRSLLAVACPLEVRARPTNS